MMPEIEEENYPNDIWQAIYNHQFKLMSKYHEVEVKNGFPDIETPLLLNDPADQLKIKEFCWRVTEELAEAQEALLSELPVTDDFKKHPHTMEELSDALHFLTEIFTMISFDHQETFPPGGPDHDKVGSFFLPTYYLGLAANCLKNKPWKSSHLETDENKFIRHLREARCALINIFIGFGCSEDDIWDLYMSKNKINYKRIESNY